MPMTKWLSRSDSVTPPHDRHHFIDRTAMTAVLPCARIKSGQMAVSHDARDGQDQATGCSQVSWGRAKYEHVGSTGSETRNGGLH